MANVSAELGLKIDKFTDALEQAKGRLGGFAHGLLQVTGGLAVWDAMKWAIKGVQQMVDKLIEKIKELANKALAGLKTAFDRGGYLSDLASRTGIAATELQVLEQAFIDNGIVASQVGQMVNRLQRAIVDYADGLSTPVRAFGELGLAFEDLDGKPVLEQFNMVKEGLRGIDDHTRRTGLGMQILGRSGGMIAAFIDDVFAIDKATASVGKQAKLLEDHATVFDRIADILASFERLKTSGLFVGMASELEDVVLPILEKLDKLDFAEKGQAIGKALRTYVDAAARALSVLMDLGLGGSLKVILAALEVGFKKAANFLWSGLIDTVNMLAKKAVEAFQGLMEFLNRSLLNPAFWEPLKLIFQGLAFELAAAIKLHLGAFMLHIPGLDQRGMDLISSTSLDRDMANNAFKEALEKSGQNPILNAAVEQIKEILKRIKDTGGKELFEIPEDAEEVLDDFVKLVKKGVTGGETIGGLDHNEVSTGLVRDEIEKNTNDKVGTLAGSFAAAVDRIQGRPSGVVISEKLEEQTRLIRDTNGILREIKTGQKVPPSPHYDADEGEFA